jgi:hypothetical protein
VFAKFTDFPALRTNKLKYFSLPPPESVFIGMKKRNSGVPSAPGDDYEKSLTSDHSQN